MLPHAPHRRSLHLGSLITTLLVVVLLTLVAASHVAVARAARREHVRAELEPVFADFLASENPARLDDELRPIMRRSARCRRCRSARSRFRPALAW